MGDDHNMETKFTNDGIHQWYNFATTPKIQRRSNRNNRRHDEPSSANDIFPAPEFTGSAAGHLDLERGDNPLYQVPIDGNGGVSFGNWPYPGKGLFGLGYNFKPVAAAVMPTLLVAGLGLLYVNIVNAARYGRKKRSVPSQQLPDPAEEELNSIHRDFLAATEACWNRFACESQKAVRKNDFVNDLVKTAFGSYVENPEADHAREMPDDDNCEVFECDVLSNLFS